MSMMTEEKTARYLSQIGRCSDEGRANFESLAESITSATEEDVENVEKEARVQASRAKQEADDAIRKISKERDRHIREIHQKAEQKEKLIRERKGALLAEISRLRESFENTMKERRGRIETQVKMRAGAMANLTAVEETEPCDTLQNVAKDSLDTVRLVTASCRKIKFTRQQNDSEDLVGTLNGVQHSWELERNIPIPTNISYPELLAKSRGNSGVIMTNEVRSGLFEINTDTEQARTIVADAHFDICDCACAYNDTLVVSDYNSKTIHIYDMAGASVKSIGIPSARARVAVTKDGLVLVGDELNGKIYFLNPRNGKIIRTLPIDGKKINGIYYMSRGWIVIQTGITVISVYDDLGVLRETIEDSTWSELRCAVSRDVIYIMYKKEDDPTTYVAMRSPNTGRLEVIVRCKISRFLLSEFIVTSSGNIAINGDNEILVFNQAPGYEAVLKRLK
ncbi:uncharacterized protein LOC121416470 [Lytechinus variegatus]|uniref:uncharacterized protein LOC121416470 n=1 Tax=Lytechinus variegatus TaxID=7654 RepID=UPI001BB1F85D|nr:uncharacterized protein LOC121416470 [Lytechinus variegatus]